MNYYPMIHCHQTPPYQTKSPLRHRDSLISYPSNPTIARRLARGLTINVPIANDEKKSVALPPNHELEVAFAAKELEISSLLSPLGNVLTPNHLTSTIGIPAKCPLCIPGLSTRSNHSIA